MAADNNLERSAILDFCEMESFARAGAPVTVLVLFDRGPGYDATNGDWTDTRLFEIIPDEGNDDVVMNSLPVECPPLGITGGSGTELDMSEPRILSCLVDYAKSAYRADNYGLIVWGHGTGWRGVEDLSTNARGARSVSFDDTSGSSMGITELASALEGKSIDLIGFDTCFGAILETTYELRDSAEYFVGSVGATPATGWNYSDLFSRFCAGSRTPASFCAAARDQFVVQYGSDSGATISTVKLAGIDELIAAFDGFAGIAAQYITTTTGASFVRSRILDKCAIYTASSYPCDAFIDVESFRAQMTVFLPSVGPPGQSATNLENASTRLRIALANAIPDSWSSDQAQGKRIGVHLIPFISANTVQATHSAGYIKGSGAAMQSSFVKESTGWVPNKIPAGSFLDRIFYGSF
jgi:hypothetical protein